MPIIGMFLQASQVQQFFSTSMPFLSLSQNLGRIPLFYSSERMLNGKTLCLQTLGNLRTCEGQCGETMWMFLQALHMWQFFPLFAKHCAFELDVICSW